MVVSEILSEIEVVHELKDESEWMVWSGINPDEWYHVLAREMSIDQRFIVRPLSVGY